MIIDSRYEVLDTLFQGEWSIVYKVRDIRTESIYALKVFIQTSTEDFYKRFSPENLYHITQINHPNIIRVFNFGTTQNQIYLISEFFQGKNLREFKFINIRDFYQLIIQICVGLDVLHSQGIIHKNLRKANILYEHTDKKLHVKIIDCSFSDLVYLRKQSNIDFLPYIAPELFHRGTATAQSDMYSLGVILYNLVTATFPFSIEQIQTSLESETYYPTPPIFINSLLTSDLNEIILKLLNKSPNQRFSSPASLIRHIQTLIKVSVGYSKKDKLINRVKMNNYTIRSDYLSQLKENLLVIKKQGHGKIFTIIGSKGQGKANLLLNFQYSILTGDYNIFTYECSANHSDPFYAIVKESFLANRQNFKLLSHLSDISKRYKAFLYGSEERSLDIPITKNEVKKDIKAIIEYLFELSLQKPVVIIIHDFLVLMQDSLEVLNQISAKVNNYPIMLIVSSANVRTLSNLQFRNEIVIPNLTRSQTRDYLGSVSKREIPSKLLDTIHKRGGGNPKVINEILYDLINKHIITKKGFENLDSYLENFRLPPSFDSFIGQQLDPISYTPKNYKLLIYLSAFETPMTPQLIKVVLGISDKTLCFLIEEAKSTNLLQQTKGFYQFTFEDTRMAFLEHCPSKKAKEITKAVLAFYKNKTIDSIRLARGLAQTAETTNDFFVIRRYTLALAQLYKKRFLHNETFETCLKIVLEDKLHHSSVSQREFWQGANLLFESAKITNRTKKIVELFSGKHPLLTDCFDKYFIQGSLYFEQYDMRRAKKSLSRCLELAQNNRQKLKTLFAIIRLDQVVENYLEAEKYLNEIEAFSLSSLEKMEFALLKAKQLLSRNLLTNATVLIDDTISFIPQEVLGSSKFESRFLIASLYERLGICYHLSKLNSKAENWYQKAHDIFNQISCKRSQAELHNSFGALALSRGDISLAFKNLNKTLSISKQLKDKIQIEKALHNFGKVYLKIGSFKKAINHFKRASKIAKQIGNQQSYYDARKHIAVAKQKSEGFGRYYRYVRAVDPKLLNWKFTRFNNLVRSFFIFQITSGNLENVKKKLKDLSFDYFSNNNYLEFYYNMLGLIAFKELRFKEAIDYFKKSKSFIAESNTYAQTIHHYKLVKSLIAAKDYSAASLYIKSIKPIITKHQFQYWDIAIELMEIVIDLNTNSVNFRAALRSLYKQLDICTKHNYFHHKILIYKLLIKIYSSAGVETQLMMTQQALEKEIGSAVRYLPSALKKSFTKELKKDVSYYLNINLKAEELHISVEKIRSQMFDLLEIENIDRIKFFIGKIIGEFFAPNIFFITLGDKEYLSSNITSGGIKNYPYIQNRAKETILNFDEKSILFTPLHVRGFEKSFLVMEDTSKLPYSNEDLLRIKEIIPFIAFLIKQSTFSDIIKKKEYLLNILLREDLLYTVDLDTLKKDIVSLLLEITGANRGFFVQIDYSEKLYGKFLWSYAMDCLGNQITTQKVVANSVIASCESTAAIVYTLNIDVADETFAEISGRLTGNIFDIFCLPIIIDKKIYGFVYLDNFEAFDKRMDINRDFMSNLSLYIGNAIKNANYARELYKKLNRLAQRDRIKADYSQIVDKNFLLPLVEIEKVLEQPKIENNQQKKLRQKLFLLRHSTENQIFYNKIKTTKIAGVLKQDIVASSQAVLKELDSFARMHKVKIYFSSIPKLPKVLITRSFLRILLKNIFLNSIQHSFGKPVNIKIRLSRFSREKIRGKQSVVVMVKNMGSSISTARLKSIFSEFHLLDTKYESSKKSTYTSATKHSLGLGLYLCKKITQSYGGDIWFTSAQNSVTFLLTLPI